MLHLSPDDTTPFRSFPFWKFWIGTPTASENFNLRGWNISELLKCEIYVVNVCLQPKVAVQVATTFARWYWTQSWKIRCILLPLTSYEYLTELHPLPIYETRDPKLVSTLLPDWVVPLCQAKLQRVSISKFSHWEMLVVISGSVPPTFYAPWKISIHPGVRRHWKSATPTSRTPNFQVATTSSSSVLLPRDRR